MTLERIDIKMIENGFAPVILECDSNKLDEIIEKEYIEYISLDETESKTIYFKIIKKQSVNSLVKII